jgi:hypothetical protein
VDLGDGSPPQVFKAATKDELIEKILNAQLNASKRIKELKAQNKQLQQKVEPDPAQPRQSLADPRQLTQDENLEITAELQSDPASAISKLLKAAVGAGPEEIREALATSRELKEKQAYHEIGSQFIATHPEYPITVPNEKLMAQYIQKNNLAWTVKNLEIAFTDLVDAGLIKLPSQVVEEEPTVETALVETEHEPVVTAAVPKPAVQVPTARAEAGLVEVPRRKKTVVGISSSQTVATVEPETPHEVSVSDMMKLSPSERRRIVLRQLGQ